MRHEQLEQNETCRPTVGTRCDVGVGRKQTITAVVISLLFISNYLFLLLDMFLIDDTKTGWYF